jgi:hypothetical protein
MRTAAALVVLAAAAALFAATGAAAPANPKPSISIGPIDADFIAAKRETYYSIRRFHLTGKPEAVTVTWTLKLELVDPAGKPDPATPGSGAAVDLGCTNAGVGTHEPQKATVQPGHQTPAFIWHHPDADASIPPGMYHCNHADMGPHGHQGLITVVVADSQWECTATYKGTNSSTANSVKNGDASEPKCSKVG